MVENCPHEALGTTVCQFQTPESSARWEFSQFSGSASFRLTGKEISDGNLREVFFFSTSTFGPTLTITKPNDSISTVEFCK